MENKGHVLMQKYEIGRLLGQGTFAKVYLGRNIETGQSVAIKVINKEKVQRVGLIDQTKREISVMGRVRHPNVVTLYEVMATKTKIYLVMEYAKGGELFEKVAKGKVEEALAKKYFQQLIRSVDYCHSRGVYHRDLKPENLLLDENGNLKISDFGLSALAESARADGLLHTTCGTPAYVAPEVIARKGGYDGAKADIWSCGVILFVLLAGRFPFHDANLMELYRKISNAEYKFPKGFPGEVRRLLKKILDPNPCTRISITEIMKNPWFRRGSLQSNVLRSNVLNLGISVDPVAEEKLGLPKPSFMTAFDIISLSNGLDLSGLFVTDDQKNEAKFTSASPASAIISRLEHMASHLKLKVNKKEEGLVKLEQLNPSRYGKLCMDVELFQITPSFHLVELRKSRGHTLEFQKMLQEDIRPALKEVIWAWHGEQHDEQ